MESILQSLPQLLAYQPALVAMVLLCIYIIIQSVIAGVLGLGIGDEVPGRPLKGGHVDRSFRVLRVYANSTENLAFFVTVAFIAIVAGVSPVWVNGLVGLHVFFRVLYSLIYYRGAGKVGGGLRTIVYVLGLLMNFILAVMTAYAMMG